jgi:hypothetical protein
MLFKSAIFLLFLGLLGSSHASVDLTPAVIDRVEDGVTYREVSFKTTEGKVLFTLPPGWTIRGQKDRAQMTAATDKSPAEAAVDATSLEKPEPLNEAVVAKFKQQVLAALPAGSAKVTTLSEAENSIMPGGNPSFELVITYDLWGKTFQRSAILVNGPQDRLTFRFTCLKSDFAVFNTHFRRSLMTWREVTTKPANATAPATASN